MGVTPISMVQTRLWFAKRLARLVGDENHGLFFTPVYALALNYALTVAYVAVAEFATLLTFYGVTGYTFCLLTVLIGYQRIIFRHSMRESTS
ncbi:hypothetical protein QBC33DRAFT_564391 [Phialemonium atrogriseum]|uniref:Uncharacterized protein n=1 Tax=Phialemonium atrogriseum TaxID=1093897 RepID=A0AAJ0BRQ2_9PEZI|nr:uncharacterized protein QBC33DRAFT_564391 [Phialemonium atrogriseum]KAK1761797.1 hypothetical protein QBC33DRAFT_564391 [Phialemonium atrogriseum]